MALGQGDPLWYYKVLGMHCNGTNGSTTFTDVKGKTVTRSGQALISTTQSKFGGASANFDGTGDYLTVTYSSDFAMGSGDFTVQCFVWFANLPDANGYAFFSTGATTSTRPFGLYTTSTDWRFWFRNSTGTYTEATVSHSGTVTNTWVHLRGTRYGNNIYLAVNGTQSNPVAISGSACTTADVMIGRFGWNTAGMMNGYMDEIEVYKGVALDSAANFTTPTSPFIDNYVIVSGTTKGSSGSLASRLVRVYRRDTGALVGSSLSNGTTGEWSVTAADSGTTSPIKHFAIMFDATADPPGSPTENGLIYDNITPY